MIQAYSINVDVAADSTVPFNNVRHKKGCTADISGTSTIELNKAGVYMVSVDGVASAATTVQLYRNGVPMPEAQSTGTTIGFTTLVQAGHNNSWNCCSSPVTLTLQNTTAATFPNINIVVTKVC